MSAQPNLTILPPADIESSKAPAAVGERTLAETIKALSRPLPASMLVSLPRKQGGKTISLTALEWHTCVRVLDKHAPGWTYEIRSITPAGSQLVVVARLTLHCADGVFYREATGIEDLEKDGYGDSSSNAEAKALKRAAAKFGLGLYLYRRKDR